MVMVRLLISEGSWLVLRMAENATRPVPDLTDIPSGFPDGSADGVESHTTRHFPSNTIGSVSFWHLTPEGPQWARSSSPAKRTTWGSRLGAAMGDGTAIVLKLEQIFSVSCSVCIFLQNGHKNSSGTTLWGTLDCSYKDIVSPRKKPESRGFSPPVEWFKKR